MNKLIAILLLSTVTCFGGSKFVRGKFAHGAMPLYVAPQLNGLLNNISAYWKLDESSAGNNRIDSTGNGYTLYDVESDVSSSVGVINNCANNVLCTYGLESSSCISGTDMSVSIWINDANVGINQVYYQSYDFSIYWVGSAWDVTVYTDQDRYFVDANVDPTSGWHNIVATRSYNQMDGGGTLSIYLDGFLEASTSYIGYLITPGWGNVFNVGNGSSSGSGLPYGLFDECGVWNVELTSTQVLALYNNGNGLPFSSFTH